VGHRGLLAVSRATSCLALCSLATPSWDVRATPRKRPAGLKEAFRLNHPEEEGFDRFAEIKQQLMWLAYSVDGAGEVRTLDFRDPT
jgi:hypothetical protein